MPLVHVVHWRPDEAGPLVRACETAGWKTEYGKTAGPAITRSIRENMPDAVVIDLSRLPSHGREVAVWIRTTKCTRHIQIVFTNGDPTKVAGIQALLPDTLFTGTDGVEAALKSLIGKVALNPVVPPAMMDRYAGKSTAQKLGIGVGTTVGAMNAPSNLAAILGPLSDGLEIVDEPVSAQQVTLWFVSDIDVLRKSMRRLRSIAGRTKLWIVWPKGSVNGLGDSVVRNAGIEVGLVDYKICSLSSKWSGMLFAVKKRQE